MARQRQAAQVRQDQSFKGLQFAAEVILWAVRWYLMFAISYRDLVLQDRGAEVDHTTSLAGFRLMPLNWRSASVYLYRAVDSRSQTIDFLLSARRDAKATKRLFCKALAQPHTVNPRTITVDKNAAYAKAAAEMEKAGELWRWSRLRQVKYLNNIVEQDHRNVKRLTRPGLASAACGRPDEHWPAARRWQ
jgi:IS6 family transposase